MKKSSAEKLNPCPCCEQFTLGEVGAYEICDICGWEDDPVQSSDPDYAGGANNESLKEARGRWQAKK
ncbi:CPCC family cysteine-rich protein [Paracidovorax anthurii]|uniref:CPCC family cysteine-rich protein n=1 Tax=Paracidovorax anthurii TaxID=78229 RepID=UPI000DD079D0|nr:CPCC family cysteine-rich protein [Paracidovorax anthurii]